MNGTIRASLLVALFAVVTLFAFAGSVQAFTGTSGKVLNLLMLTSVPEPAALILVGTGLLAACRKRKPLAR